MAGTPASVNGREDSYTNPAYAPTGRGRASFPLDQVLGSHEGHIKWPSLRAELAINLISGPSGRGPHPYDYSVMFGSASTSNGEISPRSNLRRATSAIMAALSVQADKGGTVTRIP